MSTKHTPGPWKAHWIESNKRTHTGEWVFVGMDPKFPNNPSGRFVSLKMKTGEPASNARLIAAAPELLEACRAAAETCRKDMDACDGIGTPSMLMNLSVKLEAAIEKATSDVP
jgi:hypothetical protein